MRKVLIWFAATLAALLLTGAAFADWVYWNVAKNLPDHRLASATSSWTGCAPAVTEHQFVPSAAIPENAVNAFLAREDPDFFNRPPFSPVSEIAGVLIGPRRRGRLSTLSAVYARGLLGCQSTELRKLKETLLIYRIERDLPKRNILETVINSVYFGRGSYGIAAGAEAYFGKPLSELTLGEMAFLGGVVRLPGFYEGSFEREEKHLLQRRNEVLERVVHMGAISPQQAEAAKLEPIGVQKRDPVSKKEP